MPYRALRRTLAPMHTLSSMFIYAIQHTTSRLNVLRVTTATDPEAAMLKGYIANGFPDGCNDFPRCLRGFWSYRDELSIDDGMILKGKRAFIPRPLRGY